MKAVAQVFSLDVLSKVLFGLAGILLIRFLPTGEFSRYAIAAAVAAGVVQMLAAGFRWVYVLGFQRFDLDRNRDTFVWVQLAALAALALMLAPCAGFLDGLYLLTVALIAAMLLGEFARTHFQQQLRFVRFSLVELARSGLFLAGTAALIIAFGQHLAARQVLIIQTGVIFAVVLGVFWRQRLSIAAPKPREILHHLLAIQRTDYRYLVGYSVVLAAMTQLDILTLKVLTTPEVVAEYGSALRYYALLSLALGAAQTVFLPVVQNLGTVQEWRGLLAQHRRMLMVFIPAALAGVVLSPWIIPLIDLGRYPQAVPAFQILAVSAVISFLFSPHINLLLRFEEFRFVFGLCSGALLFDFALNLLLAPRLGAVGAAVATLIAFGAFNAATYLRSRAILMRTRVRFTPAVDLAVAWRDRA